MREKTGMDGREDQNSLRAVFYELETRLLRPEIRRSPAALTELLADEFVEFGSSGRSYTRAEIIEKLVEEEPFTYRIDDFITRSLTPEIVLVTYRITLGAQGDEPEQSSLRSSLWRCFEGAWRMIFHQGTRTT